MPNIAKVTVLGAGVLGAQLAFQAANYGKTVTSYDVNDAALGRLDAIVAQNLSESGEETRESDRGDR
jgi:3-hydroxyacyl-CoA dehydrogenase